MAKRADDLQDWVPTDTFGIRLVRLRRELGWGQEEAAQACGINPKTWGSWEVGGGAPRNMAVVVDQIHKATNVDRSWLMWGSTSARLSHAVLEALPSMLDRRYRSPKIPPLLVVVRDDD